PELYCGDVDRYGHRPQARIQPGSGLPACFVQHPLADRQKEASVFGDGHELRRRDEASIEMQPAYERLGAGNRSFLKIYLWLVMQHKLMPLQGSAQAAFQGLPLDGPDVHVLSEELIIVAPIFLGLVHGGVRTLDQGLRILTVLGVGADTNAHGNMDIEDGQRSEEHTSELQSRENLVCRLLLEKKKHTS